MMSQIVMSILSSPDPSGDEEVSSFLETFVPSVWMYLSSKFSSTNRRMREVLPTAASPTRQTFTFIRLTSMKNRPATWHSLRSPLKSYGSVITADTCGRAVGSGNSVSCRRPERRRVLYFLRDVGDEGAANVRRILRRADESVLAGARGSGRTRTRRESRRADRSAARPRDRRAAESEAEDARPLNRSSETPAHEFLRRRSPPAPKNYIRPLHRDGPARRPDAPGQSLRGSRKCGPDSSGLAGSVTVSRPNARGSSYAKETTLCGGVANAEGTPTETRIDGLFAPQAEREPDSALLELAGRGRRHAKAPRLRGLQGRHDPRDCGRLPTHVDDVGPRSPGPRHSRRGPSDAGRRGSVVSSRAGGAEDGRGGVGAAAGERAATRLPDSERLRRRGGVDEGRPGLRRRGACDHVHAAVARDRRPEEEAGSHGKSRGRRIDRRPNQVRARSPGERDRCHRILSRRLDGGCRGDHERERMARPPHSLGHAAPEPQELEAPTKHRDARELPARVRPPDRAARRPVRLSSTHGVQQTHSENRRQGGRGHAGRWLPPLRESSESVRPAARVDPGADETPDPIPGRGSRRVCEAREVSGSHVHLPRIEAGSVMSLADPKDKKEAAGSAEAEPAPKRRRRRALKTEKAAKTSKAPKAEKEEKKKRETPAVKSGQVHVYSLDGDIVKTVDLPTVFRADIRLDLIRRAVTAFQANRRQPYGPSIAAGIRHSVRWSGKGHGVSRVPRLRGTMTGAQAPGTVGGRRAHPPRPDTVWAKKVNEHERRLARHAALAALKDPPIVASRGHPVPEGITLPVLHQAGIDALTPDSGATLERLQILDQLGLMPDVERAKDGRHIRAGRGKMRGRRYRQPRSVLA